MSNQCIRSQLKGPQKICGFQVHISNSRGHTILSIHQSLSPTQGATEKFVGLESVAKIRRLKWFYHENLISQKKQTQILPKNPQLLQKKPANPTKNTPKP